MTKINMEIEPEAQKGLNWICECGDDEANINLILASLQDEEVREVVQDWINRHQKLVRLYDAFAVDRFEEREAAELEAV